MMSPVLFWHKPNVWKPQEYQSGSGNPVVHLVYLLPAVLIHAADLGMIVQQQLAAVGVSSNHGAVVEGRQPPAVLVVRGSTQVQQCLLKKQETRTIPSVHTMEVTHTFSRATDLKCVLFQNHWRSVLHVSISSKDHRRLPSVSTRLSRPEVKLMLCCV